MATLRIPVHQPQSLGGIRPARTVAQTVRAGWVWAQRGLLALALVLLVGLALLPRLGIYRPVTVLSGSMRPSFSPGDMVVVVPESTRDVRVGQVISYRVPTGEHQVETHRVVRIISGGAHPVVQTRGDANNWPDPWTARLEGTRVWRVSTVVPRLGYLVNWMRDGALQKAALLLAPALLALMMLWEIWRGRGGSEPRNGLRDAPTGTGAR